jgi:undecaprenyl phosphate-alpha-L-ara4N flippase subunit ArnE
MLRHSKTGVLLMFLSSICVCAGQLWWKLSGGGVNLLLAGGFVCYGAGALLMLRAYRYGSLSVLQPLLSMNYVFAALIGRIVLGETMSAAKIAGILLITGSVALLAGADDAKAAPTRMNNA